MDFEDCFWDFQESLHYGRVLTQSMPHHEGLVLFLCSYPFVFAFVLADAVAMASFASMTLRR